MLLVCYLLCCLFSGSLGISIEPRILGAEVTDIKQFPYILSVEEEGVGHVCSAVIIGHTWALTDGWCTMEPELDKMVVRAGISQINFTEAQPPGGSFHRVAQWIRHPNFNSSTRDFDIALLNIFPPFEYSETVFRAKLPTNDEESPDAGKAVFAGWGAVAATGNEYRVASLHSAVQYIFRDDACAANLDTEYKKSKLCTREPYNAVAHCWYEDGGPVVHNHVVYGVSSYPRTRCSDPRQVKVFGRVAAARDWIRNITKL